MHPMPLENIHFGVLLHTTLQHMGKHSSKEFQKAFNGGVY